MKIIEDALTVPNLLVSLILLVIVILLTIEYYRLKRYVDQEFDRLLKTITTELPPMIVGEIQTRWDMDKQRRDIAELDAKVTYVEQRLDARGNGTGA